MKKIIDCFILSILIVNCAFADGQDEQRRSKADVEADASIADKRLPPVFPGEEVNDGNKKIKVWSTAGGVPVSEPPEPWKQQHQNNVGEIGVVIDNRDETKR